MMLKLLERCLLLKAFCLPMSRYREVYEWSDKTVGYFGRYRYELKSVHPLCAYIWRPGHLYMTTCLRKQKGRLLCVEDRTYEEHHDAKQVSPRRKGIKLSNLTSSYTVCPDGHWTHTFLACDMQSDCWEHGSFAQNGRGDAGRNMTSLCLSTLFTCNSGVELVSYSLVCDHTKDCLDDSDEDFCVYPSCSGSQQFECYSKEV